MVYHKKSWPMSTKIIMCPVLTVLDIKVYTLPDRPQQQLLLFLPLFTGVIQS